ncbi:hypothetical protein V6N11_075290 [Hibiscus sabdariffa]|uniref:Uncharacterized protein n=1 Tax=Hibiscus sabdariffa TaxID=183260 RepID=A0ABR2R6S4_9ROSI
MQEEGNSQFPAPVKVASGSSKEDGKAEWKLFDTALDFFPPVAQEGKLLVQPSRDVLDVGAQQWSNALVGTFLGKSLILSVFQKTADKLWGREGSVEIRFLAPKENCPNKKVSASDLIIGEGGPEVGVESVSAMLTSGIGSLIVDGGVGSTVGAPEIAYGDGSLKGDGFVDSSVGAPEIVSGDGNLEVDGITISVADIASGKRGAVHVGVGASDGGNYISEDGDKLSIVVSPNRFDNLSSIEVDHVVSPRKERLAAAGVGDLLNQLKAKGKGGGPKNNKKGRGKKGGASPSL